MKSSDNQNEPKEIVEESKNEKLEELLSITKDLTEEDLTKKENPDRKKYTILVMLLVTLIVIAIVLTVVALDIVSNKEKEKEPTTEEKEELNPPVEDPVPNEEKKYELVVYYSNGEYLEEKRNESDLLIATIPTETLDAEYLNTTRNEDNLENYHVLYKDNDKIKIYDAVSKTSTITSLSASYQKYEFIYDQKTNEIYGIAYYSDIIEGTSSPVRNTSGFFNIKTGKILYKNLFDVIYFVSEDKIAGKNTIDTEISEHELLSNSKEKTYAKTTGKNNDFFELIAENNYIAYIHTAQDIYEITDIYTTSGKKLVEKIDQYSFIFDKAYNITFTKNNKVEKYTPEGTKISESKEYDKVLQLIEDFFVVSLNGKLVITNFNDMEIILGNWNDSSIYYLNGSGYKEKNDFLGYDEGIFICVETDQEGIQYYFNIDTKEVKELPLPQTTT